MLPTISPPLLKALLIALLGTLLVLYIARRALGKYNQRIPFRVYIGLPAAVVLAVFVADGFMVVEPGTVRVVSYLGNVRERSYTAGFHYVLPGSRHAPMVVRRQIFELSGGSLDGPDQPAVPDAAASTPAPATPAAQTAAAAAVSQASTIEARRTVALSLDRVPLSVDLTFPYQLSPDLAWKVYAIIGLGYEQQLLMPAARAALRDAAASFTWSDAVSTKRTDMETRIHTKLRALVEDNLVRSGFTQHEADNAFSFMAPQVRRLAPPKRILSAVSEAKAAEEDLKRQAVLNEIAAAEAVRRGNEGVGVRRLFDKLEAPKGMTSDQMRQLLYALADKQRADSLQRAVEKDQVKVIVIGGGSNPQVSVPAP